MRTVIEESGMKFEFNADEVYVIEKSPLHKTIGNGIKTVEFIVARKPNDIWFVEAKSSSPQPTEHNREKFDVFIADITTKFMHSFQLYLATTLHRFTDETVPSLLKDIDHQYVNFKFILVINRHKREWIPPIQAALSKALNEQQKIWRSRVVVLNDIDAKEYGVIAD